MKGMTKTKAFLAVCLLSVLLFMVTCWSAILQDTTPYWIESIGFFILCYLCIDGFTKKIKELSPWTIGFAVILGLLIIHISMQIMDFSGSLGSLMIFVSAIIATLLAVICYINKKPYSFVVAYVIIALINSVVANIWNDYYVSRFI